jgi:hypothetical protein
MLCILPVSCCFPEDGPDMCLRNLSRLSKDYICQKIELFITTGVRTPNPTYSLVIFSCSIYFNSLNIVNPIMYFILHCNMYFKTQFLATAYCCSPSPSAHCRNVISASWISVHVYATVLDEVH